MNSKVHSRSSELVRELRVGAGLSQRGLAELAGTSGPTVAAYESGTKEPRLSTLERLVEATGASLEVSLRVAHDAGSQARARRERRSRALGAAVAAVVRDDWPRARDRAIDQLEMMRAKLGANRATELTDEWSRLIDAGPEVVARALVALGERGHDLRQMSPFAGLLSDRERRAVLAAVSVDD